MLPTVVYDTRTRRRLGWNEFVAAVAASDAVFLGEQHDDPACHRLEERVFDALRLARPAGTFVLGMEMFERDQQPPLDDYLAGRIDAVTLGERTKLWSNFDTDYRPTVDSARLHGVPVAATNAPAVLVKRVAREGLAAVLASLLPDEQRLIAREIRIAPPGSQDPYRTRFESVIGAGHGDGSKGMDAATVQRFFEAQCVRDETMAESVVRLLDGGKSVLHVNGGFHSDAGLGAVACLRRRKAAARIVTIKPIPVKGWLEDFDPRGEWGEANFLVIVPDFRPLSPA